MSTAIKIVVYLQELKSPTVEVFESEIPGSVQLEVWEIVNEARRNKPGKVLTEDDHAAFLFGLGTMVMGEQMKRVPGKYQVLRVAITAGPSRVGSNIEKGNAKIPPEQILKYEGHNLNRVGDSTVH